MEKYEKERKRREDEETKRLSQWEEKRKSEKEAWFSDLEKPA